jgi:hypothetical protein
MRDHIFMLIVFLPAPDPLAAPNAAAKDGTVAG